MNHVECPMCDWEEYTDEPFDRINEHVQCHVASRDWGTLHNGMVAAMFLYTAGLLTQKQAQDLIDEEINALMAPSQRRMFVDRAWKTAVVVVLAGIFWFAGLTSGLSARRGDYFTIIQFPITWFIASAVALLLLRQTARRLARYMPVDPVEPIVPDLAAGIASDPRGDGN